MTDSLTLVRRIFLAASIAMGCAIAFGSWAPFDFHESSLAIAWHQFLAIQFHFSRSDVLVNVLLAIPFTFAVCGSLAGYPRSAWSAFGNVVIAIVLLAFLSLACELGQSWIAGRVPSALDWMAQQVGGSIGCIAWLLGGRKLAELIGNATSSQSVSHRLEHVLTLYVIAVVIWTLMPGDLLLTPQQLAAKWAAGDIELIPFSRKSRSYFHVVYQCTASFLIVLPAGVWAQRTVSRLTTKAITTPSCLLLGFLIGSLPELMQIMIGSRVASATDAVFGILGATTGLLLAARHRRTSLLSPRPVRWLSQPATWFAMGLAYLAFITLAALAPYEFTHDYAQIRKRVLECANSPFTNFGGDPLTTIFVLLRDFCWLLPAGILPGVGVGLIQSRQTKFFVGCFIVGLLAFGGGLIETGKILEVSQEASGNDLVLRLIAFSVGLVSGIAFVRPLQSMGDRHPVKTKQQHADPLNSSLNSPASGSQLYVRGFDGLRALACLAVFGVHWQHATQFDLQVGFFDAGQLLRNGNTGVAIFMSLSGFLLAAPLWSTATQQRSRFQWRQFAWHRAVRILPTYLFALFAVALATGYWKTPRGWADVLTHMAFVHNFFPQTLYSISTPFWAMAVFVQFYVFFGVFVFVMNALGWASNRNWGIAFISLACVVQLFCFALVSIDSTSPWRFWLGSDAIGLRHSLLLHLNIFLFGAAASYVHTRLGSRTSNYADLAVAVISLSILAILSTPLDDLINSRYGRYNYPVVPLLIACLLVLVPRSNWLVNALQWRPAVMLGCVSYGFYLFHEPIIKLLAKFDLVDQSPPVLFGAIALVTAACVAFAFFQIVERPLHRRLRKNPRPSQGPAGLSIQLSRKRSH